MALPKFTLTSKIAFLFATIIAGLIIVWPNLNYVELLSTGDHGRDLYAADAVLRGEVPYRDFWWVYGPIMPYYYGFFNLILGTKITSVLFGKAVLEILLGVFFYLGATSILRPALGFIAAVWFLHSRQEFFFTFNHIGGILMGLIVCWSLLSYIRRQEYKYLIFGSCASLALMLIKINFGLASLVGLLSCTWVIDRAHGIKLDIKKKKFYLLAGLLMPAAALLIYWLLMVDLPFYYIRQCHPYFGDDQPHHVTPWTAIPYYLTQHWLTIQHNIAGTLASFTRANNPFGILFASFGLLFVIQHFLLHGATLLASITLLRNKLEKQEQKSVLLALMVCAVFFGLYFHEFLVSGVWYRSYWSWPYLVLFHFLMIHVALRMMPRWTTAVICCFMGLLMSFSIFANHQTISAQKTPQRFLSMERGGVYVGNEEAWTSTVNAVTAFLNAKTKTQDAVFALPYDCLYYYLSGKSTPTEQLIFFEHIKISQAQEASIIQQLENKKIGHVLMSNRIASSEIGIGIFGQTYCPLISRYIQENFTPIIREGGNWQAEPGWGHNHGVIILKRKSSL